jgi:hypothetical protein
MRYPEKDHKVQEFSPRIAIGNRVVAIGNLTIGAVREVITEDDVLLASNVIIRASVRSGIGLPDNGSRIGTQSQGFWVGTADVICKVGQALPSYEGT